MRLRMPRRSAAGEHGEHAVPSAPAHVCQAPEPMCESYFALQRCVRRSKDLEEQLEGMGGESAAMGAAIADLGKTDTEDDLKKLFDENPGQ